MASNIFGESYVVPLQDLFDNIKKQLGTLSVCLLRAYEAAAWLYGVPGKPFELDSLKLEDLKQQNTHLKEPVVQFGPQTPNDDEDQMKLFGQASTISQPISKTGTEPPQRPEMLNDEEKTAIYELTTITSQSLAHKGTDLSQRPQIYEETDNTASSQRV